MARALVLSIAVFAFAAAAVAGETVTAFGDSFTEAANSWVYTVAQTKGWTLTNRAASGSQLGDAGQVDRIFEEQPGRDSRYTLLTGYNDMRARGRAGIVFFRGTFEASLAHLALLHEEKVFAADPRILYHGVWQDVLVGTRAVRATEDPAATATLSVRGETVYVVAERFHTGGGEMLVSVDGVEYGPFNAARNLPTNRGRASAPFLIRITSLKAGTHKVVISKSRGSAIAFGWVAGVERQPAIRRPLVYAGNAPRMQTNGYVHPRFEQWSHGSDQAVASYNDTMCSVVTLLQADGLDVTYVDVSSAYDPDTAHIADDRIHPSALGHTAIANAFLNAVTAHETHAVARRENRGP
ncbi:MAG TPA: hypothetical protein VGF69_07960 [Thermoanaerobaculia bacterium]|jgi:hypothetical protein